MLAEDDTLKLLKERYVVAIDEHSTHNTVPFGVTIWMLSPEGKTVHQHRYGTGNAIIGMNGQKDEAARIELHEKQSAEMRKALQDAWEKWEAAKKEAEKKE